MRPAANPLITTGLPVVPCDNVLVSQGFDRQPIHDDLERVRLDLHQLVERATASQLRRRTDGTKWTNGQMLWHMVFGYLIVWRLLPGVRLCGRLPDGYSRRFAAALNASTRPFHLINYLGGRGGALVFHGPRLTRQLDRIMNRLHRRLDAETEESLARQMHFPVDWDPFFADTMTVADIYHNGTQHYDFHRAQLTLEPPPA
ncbi:DinB family protein [Krasilnikovia sp. MM14-A1259]|uniref:DinB family protein n=1 Tax=Krasilnikovia sp. MM14-A1259 TaxID=3373539 RepID=UPI0037FCD552